MVVCEIVDVLMLYFPEALTGLLSSVFWVSLIGFGVGLSALWWTQENRKVSQIPIVVLYAALVFLITYCAILLTHGLLGFPMK